MKISFVSRYGSKNIGDELIVRELENILLDFTEDIDRYSFNLVNYKSLESSFDNNIKNNIVGNNNTKQSFYKKYLRKSTLIAIVRDFVNKRRAKKNVNLAIYKQKLKQSQVLIVGGGNAIFDTEKHSSSYYYFDLIIKEAIKLKIPIYVLNVGIGPFQTSRQHKNTIKVLEKANYITVRDKYSYDLLKVINKDKRKLYKTVDPVLFLSDKKSNRVDMPKHLGITVMDLRLADFSEVQYRGYIDSLKSLISYFIENSDYKISVFCTELKDINALMDLEKQLEGYKKKKNLYFKEKTSLDDVLNVYYDIDLLIGTRMHSTIIAFSQGIPFIGINWQQKVKGFFEMVNYEQNLLGIYDFIKNYRSAINKVNEVATNYKFERNYILKKKEQLSPKYEINKKILKEILKDKTIQS
ncbi:hypothetical protein FHP05_05185 [Cerasibacillus terrae]|uniref:Polysaccharide pyruvyl transferase domain-containing protein n=1 Tax=Cerasibacillus terrae TaxID=2498845 RepID=A0A5C8P0K3_9BACI|nr:polysaccharide pyruvyl transferase family protein [Cerasibacillus terrae]TXL66776.1 hypothetical protein FHP05_05185 [Cerasibacillus terrae]